MWFLNTAIEKKKAFMINTAFFSMIILLYYGFIKYVLAYILPFVIAAFVAIVLQKPIEYLSKKLKAKKSSLISSVLVLLVFAIVSLLLVLIFILIFSELKGFISFLSSKLVSIPAYIDELENWLLNIINYFPLSIRSTLHYSVTNFFSENLSFDNISISKFSLSFLLGPLGSAWSTAKRIPSYLIAFFVMVISTFFISASYTKLRDGLLNLFPYKTQKRILNAKHSLLSAVIKMGKAYFLIMLITFIELMLGLNLLKVLGLYTGGYILVISLVTTVVDILPVLGTGAVLVSWAAVSFFTGSIGLGVGLLVLYAVISVIRQIIEPKLVAAQAGLPAIVTIMAMFIGAKLFGVFGILILPLTIIALKLMYEEGVFIDEA